MENDDLLANVTEVAGSKVLPPCVIMSRLGRGGMGAVYRARHLNLAIDVAVKVLKPQLVSDDPSFVQRFKREGQSAASIRHQNVIGVFDVAEFGGLHYIIMELVIGETARQRVDRKGPLRPEEALQIVYEAALGLGAAHSLGIVHRDVKPDNLLIANSGQVKVADLGLAKPTLGTGGASLMSAANQVMGTPSYMPPEQWESPSVGPAADVWALGTTFWFLLTGKDAFDSRDGNFPRVMRQILIQSFPDVRKNRDDVPDAMLEILGKATAKDPTERYADGNELASAIEQLGLRKTSLRDRGEATEPKTLVSPPPKNLEQIKQWLREDNQTRQSARRGTPSKVVKSQVQPEVKPEVENAPIVDGTIVQAPPSPGPSTFEPLPGRGKRILLAVALLLIAGGGAGYWAFARDQGLEKTPITKKDVPPPVNPFAEVEAFEQAGEFAKAIVAFRDVVAAKPELADQPRLAGLLAKEAKRLSDNSEWKGALVQLKQAMELDPKLDPKWIELQSTVRATVKNAAKNELKVEKPEGKQRRNEEIPFLAQLPLDAVKQLTVDDKSVERGEDKKFATSIRPRTETASDLKIGVELVDGDKDLLKILPLDFETELRPLVFRRPVAPTKAKVVDGIVFTTESPLELSGQLETEGIDLFLDGKRLITSGGDGKFVCTVPIAKPDQVIKVTLVARKDGFVEASSEIPIVQLSPPIARVIAPVEGAAVNGLGTIVRIAAGPWLKSAEATTASGKDRVPLLRAADQDEFVGQVALVPGDNRIEVVVFDVLERASKKETRSVKCTFLPAAMTKITLRGDGEPKPLPNRGTAWVRAASIELLATAAGTQATISVGDAVLADGLLKVTDLQEGERRTFIFTAANGAAKDSWSVVVERDATSPELEITNPVAGAKVPIGKPLKIVGTWKDKNIASIVVDGKAVERLDTPEAGKGTWSADLQGFTKAATIKVVAKDKAGNSFTQDRAIELDPGTAPPLKTFGGFTSEKEGANSLGYPKTIVHVATGIELVAIDLEDGQKPNLYVSSKLVTEKQFDGTGPNTTKRGVTGTSVYAWLQDRGKGLDLLTPAEFKGLRANRDLQDVRDGSAVEWLKPPRWSDESYPIGKDPRDTYEAADSVRFAFRVAFRTP